MEKLLKLQCNSVEFEKFRFTLCCSEVSRDLLSRYCINNVTRETAQNALRLSSFFTQCKKKSLEFTIFPWRNIFVMIFSIFFHAIRAAKRFGSYLKAQFSFSSGFPDEVTSIANKNSLKSINPFLSVSKVRKTWSQKSLAFPVGKHLE